MLEHRVRARAVYRAAPWMFAVAIAIMPFAASAQEAQVSLGERRMSSVVVEPKLVDLSAVPQVSAAALKAMAARPLPPAPKHAVSDQQFAALKAAAAQQRFDIPNVEQLPLPSSVSSADSTLTPGNTVFIDGNFETECGFIPSDMGLAVGDTNVGVLEANNDCISVFTKSGALVTGPVSINSFLGLPANAFVFDPRALYDWANHRYIMLFSEWDTITGPLVGSYWVAVSTGDSPTGGFFIYHLGSFFGPSNLLDFPRLGQDRQGIYVFSNVFPNAGGYAGEEWALLPKQRMYAGLGISWTAFLGPTVFGQHTDSTQPANVWDNTDNPRAEFAVTSLNFFFGGGSCSTGCNGLVVWAISNPLDLAVFGPEGSGVFIGTANNYFLPPDAVQSGTGALIATGDVRITGEVTYGSGFLYAGLTASNGSGGTGLILYKIQPVLNINDARCTGSFTNLCPDITNAIIQSEGFWNYGGTNAAFYPTQQPDPEGNVTTAFNFSGPSASGSSCFVSRRGTVAPGTVASAGDGGICAFGQNIYTQGRWGDYSGVAAAGIGGSTPSTTMWFASMYAGSDQNWRTFIGKNGFTAPNQP